MQGAEHRIVLQQMGQGFGVGQIVDRHEFHVIPVQTRTNDIAANPAEAIDTYFHSHDFS
jgi:hypothetical protein